MIVSDALFYLAEKSAEDIRSNDGQFPHVDRWKNGTTTTKGGKYSKVAGSVIQSICHGIIGSGPSIRRAARVPG